MLSILCNRRRLSGEAGPVATGQVLSCQGLASEQGFEGEFKMVSVTRALTTFAIALAFESAGAQATEVYPSKAVRIVVSFSAGGPTDTVARVMGAKLGELLGQQFVV